MRATTTRNTITGTTRANSMVGYGIRVAAGVYDKITGNQISGAGNDLDVGVSAPANDACCDSHVRADVRTQYCDSTLGNF